MQSPINKYGEIEIIGDHVQYSIPISYTSISSLDELESMYKQKGLSLAHFKNYVFAHDLSFITNRLVFDYDLAGMKSFYYLRQIYFEDQIYYFRSFVDLAKNNHNTPILWDKNNFFLDLTDSKMKVFIFEFEGHRLYSTPPTLDGLKEIILLSLTTLYRVLGKPRITDFIDQRDVVIRFAEQILRAVSIDDVGRIVEETIVTVERKEEIQREYEARLKNMKYWARRKEIKSNKLAGKFVAATSSEIFIEKSKRGIRSKEETMRSMKTKGDQEDKEAFWNSKWFYVGGAGVAAILLVATALGAFEGANAEAPQQAKEQQQAAAATTLTSEQLANVYKQIMAGDNQAALKTLEQAGYAKLPEDLQKQMLDLYVKEGEYDKAIGLNPAYADIVVSNLVASKQTAKLKDLQTKIDQPAINYEVAYMNGDYEKLIGIARDIKLTDRRKNQLLVAYLWSGLSSEASYLAKQEGSSDMAKKISQFKEVNQRVKEYINKIDVAKNKKDDKTVKSLQQKVEQIKANFNRV
ncbi:hypothetical protein [Paenibacillus kribbensis]|uniref:hypothetical protein n=1 Tax=Paenibacillus kribbensis TaxID=172713 RepID=UPI0008384E82|nr:hypothetical protein [Paenibacillus kribbensis]